MSGLREFMATAARAVSALMLLALAASAAAGQQPAHPPGAGTVEVTVFDSLARRVLPMATVQVVSATQPGAFSRTAATDLHGRLVIGDIPPGRYRVGFMHPLLDELGVAAPEREVEVAAGRTHRVTLAIPSAERVRGALCGARASADSSAVLIGTIRDPRDRMPVAGAAVSAEWMEISFGAGGVRQRVPRITATTREDGWFALCGLPAGTVAVSARQGRDSTPRIDLTVRALELVRRDVYVPREGRGRVQGTVVTADSARPLAGARVMLAEGFQAQADARGEWSVSNVPLGTRVMEVRAIGYYPERRAVDVLADGEPVDVALATFQAVLDAVRVTASRLPAADLGAFESRQRRSGMGRYYTAEQIARRNPIETSDLLRTLPGFTGDGSLTMRGNFSDGAGNFGVDCVPEVYVDGHLMRGITASELDALVKPERIVGIEVYAAGSPKPPQFDSGQSGCGSLVVWQKPLSAGRRPGR